MSQRLFCTGSGMSIKQNKILVLGGYGGNNVGDDAQLAGSLEDLRSALPSATIVVLTPDLNQTALRHVIGAVGYAPRVSFFDYDEDWKRYAHFGLPDHTKWLQERAEWIYAKAMRLAGGISHELTQKQLNLIEEIRTARLVYYSGGGYMMGPTASRLWDAMLVCRVANLFDTPVVMSGQNIGIWIRDYDRKCARLGFPSVSVISTRDDTFSRAALDEIGVAGPHILTTHDDALFTTAAPDVGRYILRRIGMPANRPFISLSLHLKDGGLEVVKAIRRETDLPIVIVPTCPPDQGVQKDIYARAIKADIEDVFIVRKLHSHAEIKGLISLAHACVSSRHHPLIFAMGHNVPCVSVNLSPYFNAKNLGAMDLCDVGEYCLDFADRDFSDERMKLFSRKLSEVIRDRDGVSSRIAHSHIALHAAKQRFMSMVVDIYNSGVAPLKRTA